VQLVPSSQSPEESVGQVPSSHVQGEQAAPLPPSSFDSSEELQLVPSLQSPAESVGQVPSSQVHGVQLGPLPPSSPPPLPLPLSQVTPSAQVPLQQSLQLAVWLVLPPTRQPPPEPASSPFPFAWQLL
jgi:hypothetical protein